ncbi:hypothetical protein RchiOBHm_Chr1g0346491 [Rosa chinensis]|uniref:Uncharacterized protein n=1 Tax=Rosa chinensis TaxID=74649 RepID=A0A2P6SF21_ROSCH|nr:hypothetical protein RchiOBHm_Chr1g0346491 [Rosa chinensis]
MILGTVEALHTHVTFLFSSNNWDGYGNYNCARVRRAKIGPRYDMPDQNHSIPSQMIFCKI